MAATPHAAFASGGHPYLTLACVFSDTSFYANTQPSTELDAISLDLADTRAWKAIDPAMLRTLTPLPSAPLQRSSVVDHAALERDAEAQLQALVDAHRASFGLASPGVQWDGGLSHLLAPALYSYEHERLTGLTTGNALFSDSIKRARPTRHHCTCTRTTQCRGHPQPPP